MKSNIRGYFSLEMLELLNKTGYVWHCIENGSLCFHNKLSSYDYPRYHLYITPKIDNFEVSLHFDQYSLSNDGNHDEPWAYAGERLKEQYRQVIKLLTQGNDSIKKIVKRNLQNTPKNTLDIFKQEMRKKQEKKGYKKDKKGLRVWSWHPKIRM